VKSHPISIFLAIALAYVLYALDRTVISVVKGGEAQREAAEIASFRDKRPPNFAPFRPFRNG
jgi:hypothetical protein